ncbi:hypothetical protein PN465_03535 [Nodularia spumigena CS-584]|nr:hypothetical protein [Nodularia spumigena]AHJ31282.1 hypothetical protein NSP_49930 [Nodularia spumigena CCY9414]MDB9381315.1 hypothetical protein [Nodularia spumigena CS-584]MEA5559372.1 hypothetical protein [Nodularia spumigena CH309]MEA5613834.1 hypothetical protein [Nodularia spumigena UHCC 0040]
MVHIKNNRNILPNIVVLVRSPTYTNTSGGAIAFNTTTGAI